MKPASRKLLLTTHVVVSVGWLGAAAAVLALGIAGLVATADAGAMYGATAVLWRFVVLPLSLAALATGVLQGLGTSWGLVRHRWVLTKLVLTAAAVLLLLLHTTSLLPALAEAAIDGSPVVVDGTAHAHGGLPPRVHLVVASGGTVLLLFVTTALSVYKPWGPTRWGRRAERTP